MDSQQDNNQIKKMIYDEAAEVQKTIIYTSVLRDAVALLVTN